MVISMVWIPFCGWIGWNTATGFRKTGGVMV
jgi:hypothetical protein